MAEAYDPEAEANEEHLGKHRVCLNTIVRKTEALNSDRLKILPMGSRVNVVQQKDRRVRIDQPIEGWCSLVSTNGAIILKKIEASELNVKTPQARDPNRPEHLKTKLQDLTKSLSQQRHEQEALLGNNPELKTIYEDIKSLEAQIKRTQSEHSRLEDEKIKKSKNKSELEDLHLKIEDAKLSIEKQEQSILEAQRKLDDQANKLQVKNPYELELAIGELENKRSGLGNQIQESDKLLQKLQAEKQAILSMMQSIGLEYEKEENEEELLDIRVEDVMKWGKYGMSTVEYVSEKVVGVKFEAPLNWPDETWPQDLEWPEPSDGTYGEELLIPDCLPNQTIFFERKAELPPKTQLVSGGLLLEKLNLVMSQMTQHITTKE